jgi:uncharacterized protein YukE
MSDWGLVGGEPAAGDPNGIRTLCGVVDRAGDAAHDAQMGLQNVGGSIAGSIWEGDAADKFAIAFDGLAPDLGLMASSYYRLSEALREYALDVERLQVSANHALTRARLARNAAAQAGPALDAARQQVQSLTRQMQEVSADIRRKTLQRSLVTDPVEASAIDDAIWRSRAYHGRLQHAFGDARVQEDVHHRELIDAERELRDQRAQVDALRGDHHAAEKRAAQRIRDALEEGLRNRSNLSKVGGAVGGWVGDRFEDMATGAADIVHGIRTGDWERVAFGLRRFLDGVTAILGIVLLIAAFVVPGLGPALALVIFGLAASKALLTAGLMGRVDPHTGRRVDGIDLLFDGIGVAFAATGAVAAREAAQAAIGTTIKSRLVDVVRRPVFVYGQSRNPYVSATTRELYKDALHQYAGQTAVGKVKEAAGYLPVGDWIRNSAENLVTGQAKPFARPCYGPPGVFQ